MKNTPLWCWRRCRPGGGMYVRLVGIAAFASAIGWASMAQATEYYVAVADDQVVVGVDLGRTTSEGQTQTTWVTMVYKDAQVTGTTRYQWTLSRVSVNCARQTFLRGATSFYDNDGSSVTRAPANSLWSDIIPESRMDGIAIALCKPESRKDYRLIQMDNREFREFSRGVFVYDDDVRP